jgi:hypothetical protein
MLNEEASRYGTQIARDTYNRENVFMAQLFQLNAQQRWCSEPLGARDNPCDDAGPHPFRVVQFGEQANRQTALLVSVTKQAFINGTPIIAHVKVLAHQDEILIGSARWYFSSESPPQLSEFHLGEGQRRPKCGVCRTQLQDGQPCVVCPRCGRVFHQVDARDDGPEKHCFTYREHCLCGHPTALSEDHLWQPGEDD